MSNKKIIFLSAIITFIFSFLIVGMKFVKLIPPGFNLLPIHFTGAALNAPVTINTSLFYGIVMSLIILFLKKNFISFKEILKISFVSSLILVVCILIAVDLVYFISAGLPNRYVPSLIIADLGGLIWFTVAFAFVSILINGIYFKIKKSIQKTL